jgi:hypothetical protein
MNTVCKRSALGLHEILVRIEEMCLSISFYFTKIYSLESDLGKRSKYAYVAKHTIFLAIQRSKFLALDFLRRIETHEQYNGIRNDDVIRMMASIVNRIELIESDYKQEKYAGIVGKLEAIGVECSKVRHSYEERVLL